MWTETYLMQIHFVSCHVVADIKTKAIIRESKRISLMEGFISTDKVIALNGS